MKTSKTVLAILAIVVLAAAAMATFSFTGNAVNGSYDEFAQCLTTSGVKMYGAYWCPHCNNQKAAFGSSWKYVSYVECSLPGGQGQTQECTEAGITGYPTWVFQDGSRVSGEQSFETLSQKSGCEL